MSWVFIALLAVLFPIGLTLAISAIMWFMQKEESVIAGRSEPNPTRAVRFERNIPGKDTRGSE